MPALSKFFAGTLGFKLLSAECHEISHVWHPNCYLAIWDALPDGVLFCLRTYGTLYILNSMITHRCNVRRIDWKKVLRDTLRSSLFLTMNLILFLSWLCQLRRMLGFAIWPTVSFVNSFLGSLMAIFIEKKKRRPVLALYLLNLASESIFRQLVHRSYLKPISNGQFLLFATGLAYLFFHTSKHHDNDVISVLRLTHGDGAPSLNIAFNKLPETLKRLVVKLRALGGRHPLCHHHPTKSCISNAVEPSAKNFTFGLLVSLALKVVADIKSPSRLLKALTSWKLLRLPVFLAAMPLIYQSSQCLLYRTLNKRLDGAQSIAGGLSGLAMLIWPNTSIAMYTLWKAIELAYYKLAERCKWVPMFSGGDALLYSLSTGYLLGVAVIEPQALRRSYYKFLCGVTGNRMVLFNRRLIETFGFESNKMFSNYFAKLHPKFTTINPELYMPVRSLAGV